MAQTKILLRGGGGPAPLLRSGDPLRCDRQPHLHRTEERPGGWVGALAHRNLKACRQGPLEEKFIQVTFPHVQDSIEAYQIRQLAHDLNEYTRSLHRIDGDFAVRDERINPDQAAADLSPIPEAIKETLRSPFPAEPQKDETPAVKDGLESLQSAIENKRAHVEAIFRRLGERCAGPDEAGPRLRVSHYGGELLLTCTHDPKAELVLDAALLGQLQAIHGDGWQRRTVARQLERGRYALSWNAELPVEHPERLAEQEVADLLYRTGRGSRGAQAVGAPLTQARALMLSTFSPRNEAGREWMARMGARVRREAGELLVFEWPGVAEGDRCREQRASWRVEAQRYLILESTAASAATVARLAQEAPARLIELTLVRNGAVDLVDFGIGRNGELLGRVVHPLAHLEPEELRFIAYVLAREVDRLEFVLSGRDYY